MDNKSRYLLEILNSGDSERFAQVINQYSEYARSIASGLFDDDAQINQVAENAINKVTDWINSRAYLNIKSIDGYIRKIIRNSVIDQSRVIKEKYIPITKKIIDEDMVWLDEAFAKFEDEEDVEPHGWRILQVKTKGEVLPEREYPEHPVLKYLLQLLQYRLWWDTRALGNHIKITCPHLRRSIYERWVNHEYNQLKAKRWAIYKDTLNLLSNISSMSEALICQRYLWGLRQTDIAKELDVTKPYVSKVINKWLDLWQWDRNEERKRQIVLLTNHIAYFYYRLIDRRQRLRIRFKKHQALYNIVITNPKTRSYFHDLKESDIPELAEICEEYYLCWFASHKLVNFY